MKRTAGSRRKKGHPPLATALAQAVQWHRAGRLDDAETVYRRVLERAPEHPDALHFLGVLYHQRGQSEAAAGLIGRAVAAAPGYADAHNNLGNVRKEQGRHREAIQAYRRVIELRPESAAAYSNLGAALRASGALAEAVAAYERAIELDPRYVDAHHNLGNALRGLGRLREATAHYRLAVALDPNHPEAPKLLGLALYTAGRVDEAREVLQGWLEKNPHNPVAIHLCAACSGRDVPARASDAYVEQVFDGLSATFDEHLADLDYRAPQQVLAAVQSALGEPQGALAILDAGCGTGLCGPGLRGYARRLVGVDLSAGMLARARPLGVYDELIKGELTAFLHRSPRAFDLVVCADTLCYFGDLEPFLAACAGALRAAGQLVFTVEKAGQGETFTLQGHGRYSHTEAYLRVALAGAAFAVRAVETITLRKEAGRPVPGLLAVAAVPAADPAAR